MNKTKSIFQVHGPNETVVLIDDLRPVDLPVGGIEERVEGRYKRTRVQVPTLSDKDI